MNVVVVGCGRVGAELAYGLYQNGHEVTVIDRQSVAFNNLPADFRGRTVEGEVPAEDVMLRAGVPEATGLAAVTNSDSVNAVVAYVAEQVYRLPHVVVRNYDPRHRPLQEILGLTVVSSSTWGAQRLEELLGSTPSRPELSLGHGEVKVHQIAMSDLWAGRTVSELMDGVEGVAIAVVRQGHAALVQADTRFEPRDVLHMSGTDGGVDTVRKRARPLEEA